MVYLITISAKITNMSSFFDLFNYSMFGAAVMTYLFQRSVAVSEKITSSKYPEYAHYKSKVNRILMGFTAYVPKQKELK